MFDFLEDFEIRELCAMGLGIGGVIFLIAALGVLGMIGLFLLACGAYLWFTGKEEPNE